MPRDRAIHIADWESASEALSSPERAATYDAVVSIGNPGSPPPMGFERFLGPRLRLEFHDIDREPVGLWAGVFVGPRVEDIEALLSLGEQWQGAALVHCHAGISRSSAAAFVLWSQHLGAGQAREALARVIANQPNSWPNRLMVQYAERLLTARYGAGFPLLEILDDHLFGV